MLNNKKLRLVLVSVNMVSLLFVNTLSAMPVLDISPTDVKNTEGVTQKNTGLPYYVVNYTYDAYSRLIQQTYSNHIQSHYAYGAYSRLVTLIHLSVGKITQHITQFVYTYDSTGNIRTRIRTNGRGQKASEAFGYDKNNNLQRYQCQGALCPKDQRHNTISDQHYAFDVFNNIKTICSTLATSQGKLVHNTTTYQYEKAFPTRLVGYQNSDPNYGNRASLLYDQSGHMVQDDQQQWLRYDPLGRTQAIGKLGQNSPFTTHFYNGDNIQIGQKSQGQSPAYFIYGQGQLLNSEQGQALTSYLYGNQRLAKDTNGNVIDYLTDQAHSIIHLVQTDSNHQPEVIVSYAYSPYGMETVLGQAKVAPTQNRFGFDGQLTDSVTGWQFLGQGYRAYQPILHRFLSQDAMSPFNKGGINGYAFANNNPIANFDPSGHFSMENLIPHTVGGWVGFGIAILTGLVIGIPVGALVTTPFIAPFSGVASIAASGGIGGMANAVGQYVGHGIDSHHWEMSQTEGANLATAFDTGVVLGAVTEGVSLGVTKLIQSTFFPTVMQKAQRAYLTYIKNLLNEPLDPSAFKNAWGLLDDESTVPEYNPGTGEIKGITSANQKRLGTSFLQQSSVGKRILENPNALLDFVQYRDKVFDSGGAIFRDPTLIKAREDLQVWAETLPDGVPDAPWNDQQFLVRNILPRIMRRVAENYGY